MNLSRAGVLHAEDPIGALLLLLAERGVLATVQHIFIAYGGSMAPAAAEEVPLPRAVQLGEIGRRALRQDLLIFIGQHSLSLAALVQCGLSILDSVAVRTYVSRIEFGRVQPVEKAKRRMPALLQTLRWWAEFLQAPGSDPSVTASGLERKHEELVVAARAAQEVASSMHLDHKELIAVFPVLYASVWTEASKARQYIERFEKKYDAESSHRKVSAQKGWRADVIDEPHLYEIHRFDVVLPSFNEAMRGISQPANHREFKTFIGMVVEVGRVLAGKDDAATHQALRGLLTACNGIAGWHVGWKQIDPHALQISDALNDFSERCSAADEAMRLPEFQRRLRGALSGELQSGDEVVKNGTLMCLAAVAVIAHTATPGELKSWLMTGAAYGSRTLLARAVDGKHAPREWSILQDAMHLRSRAAEISPVLMTLSGSASRWLTQTVRFVLASKAYSFSEGGKFVWPPSIHQQEEKFTIGGGTEGYLTNLRVRGVNVARCIHCVNPAVWSEHWRAEDFRNSDFPLERIPVEVRSALEPGPFGYLAGYGFASDVTNASKGLTADARILLLPLMTVPIRKQWWGNGAWFHDAPSPRHLFWLLRWLARMDPLFKAAVFDPLCPAERANLRPA